MHPFKKMEVALRNCGDNLYCLIGVGFGGSIKKDNHFKLHIEYDNSIVFSEQSEACEAFQINQDEMNKFCAAEMLSKNIWSPIPGQFVSGGVVARPTQDDTIAIVFGVFQNKLNQKLITETILHVDPQTGKTHIKKDCDGRGKNFHQILNVPQWGENDIGINSTLGVCVIEKMNYFRNAAISYLKDLCPHGMDFEQYTIFKKTLREKMAKLGADDFYYNLCLSHMTTDFHYAQTFFHLDNEGDLTQIFTKDQYEKFEQDMKNAVQKTLEQSYFKKDIA